MARRLLGTALAVALGLVLSENQPLALAQSTDETNASSGDGNQSEQSADDSGRANADKSQSDNSSTANSNSEKNQSSADEHGEQGRSNNDTRSGANTSDRAAGDERENGRSWSNQQRESGERDQQSYQGQQSNNRSEDDRRTTNRSQSSDSRDQANFQGDSRRSSREGRQADWHSAIRFGQPAQGGLAIVNLERGNAFYHGGLRQGDVVISYDGRPIRSEDDFGRWAIYRPGQRVPVIVLRDGRRETVYITYDEDRNQMDPSYGDAQQSYESQAFLGVRFNPRMRGAAVISSVIPGSPAEEAGLQSGDELIAINGREIGSAREATRTIASMQPGDRVDIEFSRRTDEKTQAVLESRPEASQTAQNRRTEVQVFRGGPEYDQMNQPESGEQSLNQDAGNYDNNSQTRERDSNRRGGGLLPRLRN